MNMYTLESLCLSDVIFEETKYFKNKFKKTHFLVFKLRYVFGVFHKIGGPIPTLTLSPPFPSSSGLRLPWYYKIVG